MKPSGQGRDETHNDPPARSVQQFAPIPGDALSPGLYLVATPIGHLADISLRALQVLARANAVYCEDTRHSRILFAHYGIGRKLEAYHEHNAARVRPEILSRLERGQSVALISDAGTPLISDPGYKLARAVSDAGHDIIPIPGASALLAALTASGLPPDRFYFEGFLPPKQAARTARLTALASVPGTLVFYEAPQRLAGALQDMAEIFGAREAAVAKELTKLHEAIWRGRLSDLAARAADAPQKGEYVILVAPPPETAASDAAIAARLTSALARLSLRDAARDVAEETGAARTRVYDIGLRLMRAGESGD